MPTIHPTAILEGDIDLADDVHIGPNCVLTGPISIAAGTRLIGNAHLQGPLTMGENNTVYPFACLGFAPQHLKFDPHTPGLGMTIGDGNTFREHVSIHRAFENAHPTTIGDRNWFMASAHAGHDCIIGNDCIFANGTLLAGHVTVNDHVITGGNAVMHQFCRIGRGAMLSGLCGSGKDIPPFFTLTGISTCGSINLVGLRRNGFSREQIDDVRWVFKTLCRTERTIKSSLECLRERADSPIVAEYIEFVENSKRGICSGRARTVRGEA